jgi:hypothetical protein
MVYVNNDPANGYKSDIYRYTGAPDFYHVVDDGRKIGYLTGTFVLGINSAKNEKKLHTAVDFGVSFGIATLAKIAAMWWIRS